MLQTYTEGLCIPFFILALFESNFLAYLDATCIQYCKFSERLKFLVFKIDKTELENLSKWIIQK